MFRRRCFRRFQNSWMAHPQELSVIRGQDLGNSCLLCVFTHAPNVLAFTQNESEFTLGRTLVCEAKWELGAPLELLKSLKTDLDLVVSILPFGAKSDRSITIVRTDGTPLELQDDLGNLILAAAVRSAGGRRPSCKVAKSASWLACAAPAAVPCLFAVPLFLLRLEAEAPGSHTLSHDN
jgi:hypothetical protein